MAYRNFWTRRVDLDGGEPAITNDALDEFGEQLLAQAPSVAAGTASGVEVEPPVNGQDNVLASLQDLDERLGSAQDEIDATAAAGFPAGAGPVYVQETRPDEGEFPWLWVKPSTQAQEFYEGSVAPTPTAPAFTVDPVITGTGVVDGTLTCNGGTATGTATIVKTYQWKRDGTNISGATASTYVAQSADIGHALTCAVTATNGVGSPATATSNTITGAASATAPGAPTSLILTPGDAQVGAAWTAPASNGGSAITTYLVEIRQPAGSGSYTTFVHSASTTPAITITGLTNGTTCGVRVSAVNAIGTGTATSEGTATPVAVVSYTDPSSLPTSLKIWIPVDQLTGLSNSDPVSSATEQSGNTNHALASSAARPLYKTAQVNGKPALQFDATNDVMTFTTPLTLSGDFTVFAVYDHLDNECALIGADNFAGFTVKRESTTVTMGFGDGVGGGASSTLTGDGVWSIGEWVRSGSTVSFFENGTARGTVSAGASISVTALGGFLTPGLVIPWNGYIAETIVRNAALSSGQRSSERAYLGTKYGITVV